MSRAKNEEAMKSRGGDGLVVALVLVGAVCVSFLIYVAGSVLLFHRPLAPYLTPLAVDLGVLVLFLVPALVVELGDLARRPIQHKAAWAVAMVLLWLFAIPIYHFVHARKELPADGSGSRTRSM